ncbi:hypothetical protein EVAR_30388_1 [Eumeta japonica]|uniref:Uncharacterized protein n=1 Tax=Eumeta variegata TaxID=151549 RepID=A0A4C1W6U6_EUMVA|nr:hypothetical protein EVAR_30388_1 [Eumeta japonica]
MHLYIAVKTSETPSSLVAGVDAKSVSEYIPISIYVPLSHFVITDLGQRLSKEIIDLTVTTTLFEGWIAFDRTVDKQMSRLAIREYIVTAVHGLSQPWRSHQRIAGVLERNRIYNVGRSD